MLQCIVYFLVLILCDLFCVIACSKEYAHLSQCPKCGKERFDANTGNPRRVYRYWSIKDRIVRLYSIAVLALLTRHRFSREQWPDDMRDVYDGELWPRVAQFFGQDPYTLVFSLLVDGIQMWQKQSKGQGLFSVTPIVLQCLSLPAWLRTRVGQLWMVGLVPGPKHKNISLFLEPLLDELEELRTGFQCHDASTDRTHLVRAMLLYLVADSQQMPGLIHHKPPAAYHACFKCEQKGTHLPAPVQHVAYLHHWRYSSPAL
jgi:hypothetical protein